MERNKADVILHPVRIRVVQALFGRRRLSPQQLLKAVPGTSIATLYRHLNRMAAACIVAVVETRQVRGTTQRIYALAGERAADIGKAELRRLSREDHLRHFTTFVATLLDDFHGYLRQRRPDIPSDGTLLRQEAVNLTRRQARNVAESVRKVIAPYLQFPPGGSRRRYLLTTILFPDANANPRDGGAPGETPSPRHRPAARRRRHGTKGLER